MTDDTTAAVERLREIAKTISAHPDSLFNYEARALLAHIAAKDAEIERVSECAEELSRQYDNLLDVASRHLSRAEAAEAALVKAREALERLNNELDAFWNEPAEIKYPDGRMNLAYEELITAAQMHSRNTLATLTPAAIRGPGPDERTRELQEALERARDELDGLANLRFSSGTPPEAECLQDVAIEIRRTISRALEEVDDETDS